MSFDFTYSCLLLHLSAIVRFRDSAFPIPICNSKEPYTPAETLAKSLAEPRLYTWLLGSFAAISLLMAAVGIYGVMSYSVAQRTHEIGLRVALGAQHRDVFRLVLGQGIGLAFAGILVGLLAAAAFTRFLDKMLFGVSATDPITFAGIVLGLLLVACLACWLPARRAMQVDPLTALRRE